MAALSVLSVMLAKLQATGARTGRSDVLSAAARAFVSPVSVPSRSLAAAASDFLLGVFSARATVQENRRLRMELQALSLYDEQIGRLAREVEQLRQMQGFGEIPGKHRVPATVVGFVPAENLVTIDVGRDHGIAAGCPVITATGLLGTVQSVDPHRSQVLMITDVKRQLGAIDISRHPAAAGLIRGENSSTLDLTFQDPKAPVEIGDVVVTSGFSEKIPRGIFIGRVISVENSQELGTKRAKVFPTVSIGDSHEVQVIR